MESTRLLQPTAEDGGGPVPTIDENGAKCAEAEDDDAAPDARVEVDMCAGSSIKRRTGVLKKMRPLTGLEVHRFRSPACEPRMKAAFQNEDLCIQREVKVFGNLIPFDLVEISGEQYIDGQHVVVLRDVCTGMIMVYSSGRKNAEAIVKAIKHLGRSSKPTPTMPQTHAQNKIKRGLSLPGRPQSNSLAERTSQFIIDQTTA